jgi:hypothetical protein
VRRTGDLLCPSAQPKMPGAVVHGVLDAASGRIEYLDSPQPVTPELLAATAPLLPTQVLRFSATCQKEACGHFTGSACSLVDRVVQIMPAITTTLPRCAIRATCRWFSERGAQSCFRCGEIVTDEFMRTREMAELTEPRSRPGES